MAIRALEQDCCPPDCFRQEAFLRPALLLSEEWNPRQGALLARPALLPWEELDPWQGAFRARPAVLPWEALDLPLEPVLRRELLPHCYQV